jgi:late competence protein required for DNA uptake (superfamily II DNA/RNA helicase)
MKYLQKLVNEINNYDGSYESSNNLRNLICHISDQSEYRNNPIYKYALFEAAEIMRTFGYNVQNKIQIDDVSNNANLYDIKHQAIHNYYKSNVYENNCLLDKRQKEIIDSFMSINTKRLIISAPTSFGKTFLLKEILYLNREKYDNILLVFPTIALLIENTTEIKKFIKIKNLSYNIVNNVYSKIDTTSKNIFILTPERTLKLLSDNEKLNINFFFFDEVYKIDEDFNKDEDNSSDNVDNNIKDDNLNGSSRAKAFRIALYILSKTVPEFYIAGPYLNLDNVKNGFKKFLQTNKITVKQVDFEPTLRIEIDAWNKTGKQKHPLLGDSIITFNYNKKKPEAKMIIKELVNYIDKNKLEQTIFYCSKPIYAIKYAREITSDLESNKIILVKHGKFLNHLKKRFGISHNIGGKLINSSDYWSVIKILSSGFGVHHGKLPKYIQKEILKMFNDGDIKYLFCTSTIIEGVNTNAKNVVIVNSSVGNNPLTPFAIKNIKGRAGRYYHHFVGRVFYTDEKQRQIETQSETQLNFSIYDDKSLTKIDIDNADIQDLAITNKKVKVTRETGFNKEKLPDNVFIKNRLYSRDLQEQYLNYLLVPFNFNKFQSLIGNSDNINSFLYNKMMYIILDSFFQVGIIDENAKNVYYAIISNYSIRRFEGLMQYQMKVSLHEPEEDIDKIYNKVFDQIRKIVEYEVPKLLCLFESLYQQAGRLKGYDMDSFDLSQIIRFFELGVKSFFGLFLVEYGFPIDAIRDIEDKFSILTQMDLQESINYITKNIKALSQILDDYESELLKTAIDTFTA